MVSLVDVNVKFSAGYPRQDEAGGQSEDGGKNGDVDPDRMVCQVFGGERTNPVRGWCGLRRALQRTGT